MSEILCWIVDDYDSAKHMLYKFQNNVVKYLSGIEEVVSDRRLFLHQPTTYVLIDNTQITSESLKYLESGDDIIIFWYESKKPPKIFKNPTVFPLAENKAVNDLAGRYVNGYVVRFKDIEDCNEFIFAVYNRYINKIKGNWSVNKSKIQRVSILIYEIVNHNLNPRTAVKLLLLPEIEIKRESNK